MLGTVYFFFNFYFKFYALEFFLVRVASVAVDFCQNSLFNPHLARSLLLVTRYSICITYRVIIGFCSCQELPGFVRVHPRQSLLPRSRIFFFLTLLLHDRCVISSATVMMASMSRIVRRPSVPLTAVTSVIGTWTIPVEHGALWPILG